MVRRKTHQEYATFAPSHTQLSSLTQVGGVWRYMVYDVGGRMMAEYSGGDAQGAGGVHYQLSDHQGSVRAVMNENGWIAGRHDYQPFGEEVGAGAGQRTVEQGYNAPDTSRQKYGMTERDQATGLDHTDWRKYEQNAGRWTSPDPLKGNLSDPQSLNRFTYVTNDPVNGVDPLGLEEMICFEGVDGETVCLPKSETIHISTNSFADWMFVLNSRFGGITLGHEFLHIINTNVRHRTFDPRKPECLPQDVKDQFFEAWKKSGYGQKTGAEEWAIGIGADGNANFIATSPQSTYEYNGGRIPGISNRFGGAHTHNRDSVPGLSGTDRDTADGAGIVMYVMSRAGGLVMYNPKDKTTWNERYDSNYQQNYYGIKVGDLGDRNDPKAFWNKTGVGC